MSGAAPLSPMQIFLERQKFDMRELATIEDGGGIRSIATVMVVKLVAEIAQKADARFDLDFTHPAQEWEIVADVRAPDGSAFPATFPLFLDEIGEPPAVGEAIHVVYVAADHARVCLRQIWRGPKAGMGGARWLVPATCPSCGAPVDQSVEAFTAHPACRMCQRPLPCQPATIK